MFPNIIKLGLERMQILLTHLDQPQDSLFELNPKFRLVHITGTNGKGSTAEMVASGLVGKVGIFTSPFLVDETDAIRVFDSGKARSIGKEEMREAQDRIGAVSQRHMSLNPPTDFEALVAVALLFFESQNLDFLVVEVGMGGARDATNVFQKHSSRVVAVLTGVSLDHQAFLGNTVEEICNEKCGIFPPDGVAIVSATVPCMHVVNRMCKERKVRECILVSNGVSVPTPFNGEHQKLLMQIAIEAARQCDISADTPTLIRSIQKAKLPGRMERRASDFPFPLILDGAHNAESAVALRTFLDAELATSNCDNVLFILATSKGRESIIPLLLKPEDQCVCIEFKAEGTVKWVQSCSAEEIAVLANQVSSNVTLLEGKFVGGALEYIQNHPHLRERSLVVVAGSLYLVRDYLRHVSGWVAS